MDKKKRPLFKSIFHFGKKENDEQALSLPATVNNQNKNLRLLEDQRDQLLFPQEKLITQSQEWAKAPQTFYGDDFSGMTAESLTNTRNSPPRSRQAIYAQWRLMEKDPVISIALRTHAIAALGGHETTGDVIVIEDTPFATDADKKILDEVRSDLLEMFNKVAFSIAYNGVAFGDAYARTYFEPKKGLVRLVSDEMVHPSIIQPYEQGGDTVGFIAGGNRHFLARLTTLQMARMKMPRIAYVPQVGVIAKSYRYNILEDDVNKLPIVPSMIGGSFLFAAEKPFTDFYISLAGLVGQRLVDSIDESIITVNLTGGTRDQQKAFAENITNVLRASKELANKAMQGEPMFGRVRHVLFTHQEKQLTTHGETLGSRRQGNITIDDVLFHARTLAGSLGIDLSMLGFADQLSGGLGEGGFFRASAQIAESSRLQRIALSDFFSDLIDKHMLFKYGKKWDIAQRPFNINFYGSISAFENERQQTRATAVGSAGLMTQTLDQLRTLGFSQKDMVLFMTKQMLLDQEEAEAYATAMASQADEAPETDY